MTGRKFDVVFIDFYGTVTAGDRRAVEETCARVVRQLGLTLAPAELAVIWGRRFFDALETAYGGAFRNLFDLECETLVATVAPLIGPFDPVPFVTHLKGYWSAPALQPEAKEVLAALDLPVCCVSNADTEDVLAATAQHGLQFDDIVTSEDARSYKPHAGIFHEALAKLNVAPQRVIHVGDSLHSDVGGAKPLGIATAWICREDRIFDVGMGEPDYSIRSLRELHNLVQ